MTDTLAALQAIDPTIEIPELMIEIDHETGESTGLYEVGVNEKELIDSYRNHHGMAVQFYTLIGPAGCGKTAFSHQIGAILKLPHVAFDLTSDDLTAVSLGGINHVLPGISRERQSLLRPALEGAGLILLSGPAERVAQWQNCLDGSSPEISINGSEMFWLGANTRIHFEFREATEDCVNLDKRVLTCVIKFPERNGGGNWGDLRKSEEARRPSDSLLQTTAQLLEGIMRRYPMSFEMEDPQACLGQLVSVAGHLAECVLGLSPEADELSVAMFSARTTVDFAINAMYGDCMAWTVIARALCTIHARQDTHSLSRSSFKSLSPALYESASMALLMLEKHH